MTTPPAQRVADEVRVAMTRKRMSQATLADQLGMSSTALGRRMTGEVPFDVDELERAAVELDFTITIPASKAS